MVDAGRWGSVQCFVTLVWQLERHLSCINLLLLSSSMELSRLTECFFAFQGGHVITPLPGATPTKPGSAVSRTLQVIISGVCQLCCVQIYIICITFTNLCVCFQLLTCDITWHSLMYLSIEYIATFRASLNFVSVVLTARHNARIASAVLTTEIPSVCPSVRLSVTRRYCVKTTARSAVQCALSYSKMCLVL